MKPTFYDPAAPWRREPATEHQRRWLNDAGLTIGDGISRGEASDLISARVEPSDEELEFLKFFGVALRVDASQLDAGREIARIISDPANMTRWQSREASAEQRAIIAGVEGQVPPRLTFDEAEARIQAYDADDDLSDRAAEVRETLDDRENRLDMLRDIKNDINARSAELGLKRVGQSLVTTAIESWERESGRNVEALFIQDDFELQLAARLRTLDPTKATAKFERNPHLYESTVGSRPAPSPRPGEQPLVAFAPTRLWLWLMILAGIVGASMLVQFF